VKVTDNHFVSGFFDLNEEFSRFEIAVELSFHDGEFGSVPLTGFKENDIVVTHKC